MRARARLVFLAALAVGLAGASAEVAMARLSQFRSPSSNIGCIMDWSAKRAYVRCDARAHTWQVTRRPAGCPSDIDYGQGFEVGRTSGRGHVVCAGDTALNTGKRLRYGHAIAHGGVKCISEKSGMTCRNRRGHGFFISRQRYRLF
jgi:uncharacterized protein DUF6636